MPHKRATRSAREQQNARRGTDLAPKISVEHEPIPRSVSRVLDAGRIRREYRKRKRQLDGVSNSDEDNPRRKMSRKDATDIRKDDAETSALRIKSSETIPQFNSSLPYRRVENSMMPLIKTALRQSSAQTRKVRREGAAQETGSRGKTDKPHPTLSETSKRGSDPPPATIADEIANPRNVTKEFQVVSSSAPRRLNDIAQGPPEIRKLPRGATKTDTVPLGVLSMAQKVMMEEERDKAIRHYRELKARKLRGSYGLKLDP